MKWKLLPLACLLWLLFLIPQSSSIEGSSCYLSINNDESLGLGGLGANNYVLVEVTNGSINSTLISYELGNYEGEFHFQSNVTGTIHFSDPATDYELLASGGVVTYDEATGHIDDSFAAEDLVILRWQTPLTPMLPFGFIMGMVGLGSMFGGSMWTIKKIKDHEIHEAVTEGFIIAIVGTALFIAWLWAA